MADYLFHYTCLKAAKSIVSSQIFWATNIATFDDKNELWGGLNPIDCYLEKIEETDGLNGFSTFIKKQISLYKQRLAMFNFYCISFCAEGDNSFMWSRYGKKECCMVFDRAELLETFMRSSSREKSVVSEDFIPCKYLSSKDVSSYVNAHLNTLQREETVAGRTQKVPFDYSSSFASSCLMTYEDIENPDREPDNLSHMDLKQTFIDLINPALNLKFAGTDKQYEKEKEERIVVVTPSGMDEKGDNKKKYIEIKLDKSLFFNALHGIQIFPDATDKDVLKSELASFNEDLMSKKIISTPINIL